MDQRPLTNSEDIDCEAIFSVQSDLGALARQNGGDCSGLVMLEHRFALILFCFVFSHLRMKNEKPIIETEIIYHSRITIQDSVFQS